MELKLGYQSHAGNPAVHNPEDSRIKERPTLLVAVLQGRVICFLDKHKNVGLLYNF
jgi:hypothetical protein